MADNLTDEEQLQILKNWWKENGRFLMMTVAVVLIGYFGWQWWNKSQQEYAEKASSLYIELVDAVTIGEGQELSDEKLKTAQFLIDQLQSDYSKTLYAANASLLAAKLAVDKNDLAKAEEELKKALEQGDEEIKTIAALRLARVYLAQEKYDDALQSASYDKDDTFTGLYAALRGDILVAKGDTAAAATAYRQALGALDIGNNIQRRLLEIKLSDLPNESVTEGSVSGDKP